MSKSDFDMVTVRFTKPVSWRDPFDGETVTSDRHRVAATRVIQDESETVFSDDHGEIVARWPTPLVTSVKWPKRIDRLSEIKRDHLRAYEPWSGEEDQQLEAEVADGVPVERIARMHQRQPSAIRSRVRKLGLA